MTGQRYFFSLITSKLILFGVRWLLTHFKCFNLRLVLTFSGIDQIFENKENKNDFKDLSVVACQELEVGSTDVPDFPNNAAQLADLVPLDVKQKETVKAEFVSKLQSVSLRSDIVNKSIIRSFVKSIYRLYKVRINIKEYSKAGVWSRLTNRVRRISAKNGLLSHYQSKTGKTCFSSKPKEIAY